MKIPDGVKAIIEDLSTHPVCQHGPMLKFHQANNAEQTFFACSAHRDAKECSTKNAIVEITADDDLTFDHILTFPTRKRFCHSCNHFFRHINDKMHVGHAVRLDLTDDLLRNPTKLLSPHDDDKKQAQYFFDECALKCFSENFQRLEIKKIICVGAPRLHEFLKNNFDKFGIRSILLDIDKRFAFFRKSTDSLDFFHYNMFNHFFFEGQSAEHEFNEFLKIQNDEICGLVTDPPFGCRTEILADTIKVIDRKYRQINGHRKILPIFWIFPYFMEFYIKNCMPEMEMIDYRINYTNHDTFHCNQKGRKHGSPVRMFVNFPTNLIQLPSTEGYKFCPKCKFWKHETNLHCDKCNLCPSKSGDSYRHCDLCDLCVKSFYKHCFECRRCTQVNNHKCNDYQQHQKCIICLQRGHVEWHCREWFQLKGFKQSDVEKLKRKVNKTKKSFCFLCLKNGHSERKCSRRSLILNETNL